MINKNRLILSTILLLWTELSLASSLNIQTRIIGGSPAEGKPWAAMAQLYLTPRNQQTTHLCGGSLISSRWILTAAHCFFSQGEQQDVFPEGIQTYFGLKNPQDRETAQKIVIQNILIHPFYNEAAPYDYDVALLELANNLDLPTIKLSGQTPVSGISATAAGWGLSTLDDLTQTPRADSYPDQLQVVELPVISNQQCTQSTTSTITSNMICAGFEQGGKDSCNGDSGGPLMIKSSGQLTQVGIISFGHSCAQPGKYGVYTRLTSAYQWIGDFVPEAVPDLIVEQTQEATNTDHGSSTETPPVEKNTSQEQQENHTGRISVTEFGGGSLSWFTCFFLAFMMLKRTHHHRPGNIKPLLTVV